MVLRIYSFFKFSLCQIVNYTNNSIYLPCHTRRGGAKGCEKFFVQPEKEKCCLKYSLKICSNCLTCFDKRTKRAKLPTRPMTQTPPTRNPPLTYCISPSRSTRACNHIHHLYIFYDFMIRISLVTVKIVDTDKFVRKYVSLTFLV